jgi:hypothetical protein
MIKLKQLENSIIEKKPSATKRHSLAINFQKEVDFENLWERNRDKKTSRKTSG